MGVQRVVRKRSIRFNYFCNKFTHLFSYFNLFIVLYFVVLCDVLPHCDEIKIRPTTSHVFVTSPRMGAEYCDEYT